MAGRQLTPLESALTELRAAVAQVRLPLPLPEPRQRKVADEESSSARRLCRPRLAPSMRRSWRWWEAQRSGQVDAGELLGRSVSAPGDPP